MRRTIKGARAQRAARERGEGECVCVCVRARVRARRRSPHQRACAHLHCPPAAASSGRVAALWRAPAQRGSQRRSRAAAHRRRDAKGCALIGGVLDARALRTRSQKNAAVPLLKIAARRRRRVERSPLEKKQRAAGCHARAREHSPPPTSLLLLPKSRQARGGDGPAARAYKCKNRERGHGCVLGVFLWQGRGSETKGGEGRRKTQEGGRTEGATALRF